MSGATPDAQGGPAGRRRRLLLGAGIALVVLLVAVAVWAGARDGGDPAAQPSPGVSPSDGPGGTQEPSSSPGGTPSSTTGPSVAPTAEPGAPTPSGTPDPGPFVEEVAPPVPLDEPAEADDGVVARVVEVTAVEGQAEGPGEVSGPSLRFALALVNGTDAPLDLDTVVVNLYAGPDRAPANLLAGSGEDLFRGDLAPGGEAEAVYVFRVDPALRDVVALTLSYAPGEPALLFEGPAPRG